MDRNNLLCPSWHATPRSEQARPETNSRAQTSPAQPPAAHPVVDAHPLPLADGHVLTLDPRQLEHLTAHDALPLLLDFWAPWCAHCTFMAADFEEAARLLAPGVRLGKINTEEHHRLAERFHVHALPTLVLVHQGRELGRTSGSMHAQDIVNWATSLLG